MTTWRWRSKPTNVFFEKEGFGFGQVDVCVCVCSLLSLVVEIFFWDLLLISKNTMQLVVKVGSTKALNRCD